MKIALSVFKECISTVFDAADQLLILDMDNTEAPRRSTARFSGKDPASRISDLAARGINVLICGAISRPMERSIASRGVIVHSFVRGPVEDVLAAYLGNRLSLEVFSLPGCRGRGSEATSCPRQSGRRRRPMGCRMRPPQPGEQD
ncbi:MAG: NifB/NifX family molybdenum-iron cluster-binding protein [Smithellaceae bacterium]|nr:NifB/NifX family molybdenum-iron cluster-binding protein [Syntrophaceae bacterium]MDD4241609.1 NifB/NifX family molybdenum-iron cluster-binding protein [Smithellaceae bacterium]NLX50609.1 hypothetical protein [Deltaproteobacteria bacterium]